MLLVDIFLGVRINPLDMVFRPIKQEEEINYDQFLDEMEGDIKRMASLLHEQRYGNQHYCHSCLIFCVLWSHLHMRACMS